jgi:hypothetical protein
MFLKHHACGMYTSSTGLLLHLLGMVWTHSTQAGHWQAVELMLQEVLPAGSALPKRDNQSTVTTYVTGVLEPRYFKVTMPRVMRHM